MDNLFDLFSEFGLGGNLLDDVKELIQEYIIVAAIIGIVTGLLTCFLGYKLRKIWTALVGLLVFGGIGYAVSAMFVDETGAVIGIAVGAGIVGALLGFFLWRLGCALRALVISGLATFVLCMSKVDLDADLSLIVALAVGLIIAILVFAYIRPLLIFYTAITGGFSAASSIMTLLPESTQEDLWFLVYVIAGVLAIAGIIVQFVTTKKKIEPDVVEIPVVSGGMDEILPTNPDAEAFAESTAEDQSVFAPTFEEKAEEVAKDVQETADTVVNEVTETVEEKADEAVEAIAAAAEETAQTAEEVVVEVQEAADPVCPTCGEPHKIGAKFCMKCGNKLI